MNRTSFAFCLLALLAAVAIAGCGGGGGSSTSEGSGGSGGAEGGKSESASSSYGGRGGGYGGGESSETKAASAEAGGGEGAVVSLASSPKLGMILVDSEGMTLYDFEKDKGTTSSCYGPCAEGWPPLTTEGAPKVGNGASGSKLGTTERKDGTMQVTYAGHPLYTFVGDKQPGEANGNDIKAFGASWYALKGSGENASS